MPCIASRIIVSRRACAYTDGPLSPFENSGMALEEWKARLELAALYRVFHARGWDEVRCMCVLEEEVVWFMCVSGVQCASISLTHSHTHTPQKTQEIINHITVRVPGPDAHFLINPFGLYYGEVSIR